MTDTSGTSKTTKAAASPKTAAASPKTAAASPKTAAASPKTAAASLKTATTTDADATEEKKEKPVKEIQVVIHDQDFFRHNTGDTYDGEFEAKKKDHSVKMYGQGVYTTAEGDSYSALWEADKIAATNHTIVSYNDGSKFEGVLKDWSYSGKGTYTYPDGSVLTGEFSDDCPVGNLVLTDPNGHTWLGKADHGFGWFEPVNHFYELLETTQTRIKRHHKTVPDTMQPVGVQATSATAKPTAEFNIKTTLASSGAVKAKSKTITTKK